MKSKRSQNPSLRRILASVAKAAKQHDNHMYTFRHWLFQKEFNLLREMRVRKPRTGTSR
jgi:hypothetical protein